jgi:hypothetical protein
MGLPIQKHAIYSIKVPSTGKTFQYKPFTVREEKVLALAQESKEDAVIYNGIVSVLNECFGNKLDATALAVFDVEYLLTQIRAKAVGELVNFRLACDKDPAHERTPYVLDVSKLEVIVPEKHNKKIHLFGEVGVVMRYPTLGEMVKFEKADDVDSTIMCIDYIYEGNEIYQAKDQTPDELRVFVEALSKKQLEKIEDDFFKSMPYFEAKLVWDCMICKHHHEKVIKGLHNFFT